MAYETPKIEKVSNGGNGAKPLGTAGIVVCCNC